MVAAFLIFLSFFHQPNQPSSDNPKTTPMGHLCPLAHGGRWLPTTCFSHFLQVPHRCCGAVIRELDHSWCQNTVFSPPPIPGFLHPKGDGDFLGPMRHAGWAQACRAVIRAQSISEHRSDKP
ncbi:hypothetical protein BJV78DRAFT_730365 [Lactifluus subvellereus]|nr:hypothetical protein BJV78DRAFT_730365 [Lactifluus subvellereus]